jgi:hypothetical protein
MLSSLRGWVSRGDDERKKAEDTMGVSSAAELKEIENQTALVVSSSTMMPRDL